MPSIVIVTDTWSSRDEVAGRPLSDGPGHILRGLMSQAGIAESDAHITALFNFRPPNGDIFSLCTTEKTRGVTTIPPFKKGHWLHQNHGPELARLHREIEQVNPNLVIALGPYPLAVLAGKVGVKRWRGSPMLTTRGERKLIATWHPDSIIKQWELRPVALMDFFKARKEAETARLVRPRRLIHLQPTLDDIAEFYEKHIAPAPWIAGDIETRAGQITEIGFATSPRRAIVIPFWSRARGNYWRTAAEEKEAWKWVQRICASKPLVGQNFKYDMQYLWRTMGIPCPLFHGDTMLLHHTLQPELEKGLGFLGSIYTDEPSWKFMRTDHSTLKKEDD